MLSIIIVDGDVGAMKRSFSCHFLGGGESISEQTYHGLPKQNGLERIKQH